MAFTTTSLPFADDTRKHLASLIQTWQSIQHQYIIFWDDYRSMLRRDSPFKKNTKILLNVTHQLISHLTNPEFSFEKLHSELLAIKASIESKPGAMEIPKQFQTALQHTLNELMFAIMVEKAHPNLMLMVRICSVFSITDIEKEKVLTTLQAIQAKLIEKFKASAPGLEESSAFKLDLILQTNVANIILILENPAYGYEERQKEFATLTTDPEISEQDKILETMSYNESFRYCLVKAREFLELNTKAAKKIRTHSSGSLHEVINLAAATPSPTPEDRMSAHESSSSSARSSPRPWQRIIVSVSSSLPSETGYAKT